MRFLAILFLVLFAVGCTKSPVCDIGKTVTTVVSDQIAIHLECKNPEAIKATLDQKLADLKVCEQGNKTMSLIGEYICPSLVNSVMSTVTTKIPSEWQCTGGTVKDDLKTYLLDACKKAL